MRKGLAAPREAYTAAMSQASSKGIYSHYLSSNTLGKVENPDLSRSAGRRVQADADIRVGAQGVARMRQCHTAGPPGRP